MKKTGLFVLILGIGIHAFGQQAEQIKAMEQRARDMHKAIASDNMGDWKKFVLENYSRALIDKPMTARVDTGGGATTTEAGGKTEQEKVQGKAQMFSRLHDDFGSSKISSLKTTGDKIEMALEGDAGTATITLRFSNSKPWLIEGLGVEAMR